MQLSDWKLTAVHLITSIKTVSIPITAVQTEADTLTIGALKLTETALTCTLVIISIICIIVLCMCMHVYLELIDQF